MKTAVLLVVALAFAQESSGTPMLGSLMKGLQQDTQDVKGLLNNVVDKVVVPVVDKVVVPVVDDVVVPVVDDVVVPLLDDTQKAAAGDLEMVMMKDDSPKVKRYC